MGKGTGKKPPPIGIVKQGKAAITAYFDSLKKETLPLNEVKVLLVGDSAAGKTSLVNRLLKSFYRVSCKTNVSAQISTSFQEPGNLSEYSNILKIKNKGVF